MTAPALTCRWQSAAAEQALPKTVAMLEVPLYKELELIVDAEPWGTDSEDDAHTQQLMSEYQARLASEGPLDAEALPPEVLDAIEDSHSQESQQFAEFAARLASAPEQVLRYCSEDGAQPLWPSLALSQSLTASLLAPCVGRRGVLSFKFCLSCCTSCK